jgi:hypothetical protein
LVTSLINSGLLDEVRLIVHPVAVGSGTALFGGVAQRQALELQNGARGIGPRHPHLPAQIRDSGDGNGGIGAPRKELSDHGRPGFALWTSDPRLRDELTGYRAALGHAEMDSLAFPTGTGRHRTKDNVRGSGDPPGAEAG